MNNLFTGRLVDRPMLEPLLMLAAMAIMSAVCFLDRRCLGGALFLCLGAMGFAVDWLSRRGYRSWAWISRIIGLGADAVLLVIIGLEFYSYLE